MNARALLALLLLTAGPPMTMAGPFPPVVTVELSEPARHDLAADRAALPAAIRDAAPGATLRPVFARPAATGGAKRFDALGLGHWFTLGNVSDPVSIAARIATGTDVSRVELDWGAEGGREPNDIAGMTANDMWALRRIECPRAWDYGIGSPSILVAVIDAGCKIDHPDLAANVAVNPGEDLNHDGAWDAGDDNGIDDDLNGYVDDLVGWDFNTFGPTNTVPISGEDYATRDNQVFPDYGSHGTACSGLAAGATDNGLGLAAASWNVRLLPIRAAFAYQPTGSSSYATYTYFSDLAPAIQYAADRGARVISVSYGGTGTYGPMQAAIQYARAAGALVLASAMNANTSTPYYPAAYPECVAVAATDSFDLRASFSNYGAWVDISAPGVAVGLLASGLNIGYPVLYRTGNGTSYSTPIVAAVAALLLSQDPTLSDDAVLGHLLASSDDIDPLNPGFEGLLGAGRVNAFRAMQRAHPLAGVRDGRPGTPLRLSTAPNPTSGGAEVSFELPRGAEVDLGILDVTGRRVASLVSGPLPAGVQEAQWNGRADDGRPLPSGIYFVRLRVADQLVSRRIALTR